MKRKTKLMSVALAALATLTVASCKDDATGTTTTVAPTTEQPGVTTSTPTTVTPTTSAPTTSPAVEGYMSLEDMKGYIKYDLASVLAQCGSETTTAPAIWAKLLAEYEKGEKAIDAATSAAGVNAAFAAAKKNMADCIPYANGAYDFTALSNAERTEILGILEAYAVNNGITGISLFENGGYVMYNPRVTLGTGNYIPGYGFGTLAEGKPTAALATETNAAWQYYYHSLNASDPGTANYLNDKGSEVANFYSYFAGSFFSTFMNSTKDGYDWVPELAKEKPVAMNADESGMATKWRFKVKTGADGLKYSTNSTKEDRANFNNREVAAEDYVTAFKFLLTQSSKLARGAELASTKTGAIKGAAAYYAATADKELGSEAAEKEWNDKGVGIKTYEENGEIYFEYEFTTKQTAFYSMYYITSSLYQPIPMDFLKAVGKNEAGDTYYCGYNEDKTYTPVDNSLALGAYVLETWQTDVQVTYKKNPNYVFADSKYAWEGVKIKIFPAMSNDPEASIKEFLAGNTDSAGIPKTRLDEFKNDPRTRTTTGDSNFKLNVNACDQETWNYLFGTDGVVASTDEADYWQCEPALSNSHFVRALSYSIDRNTFADARGSIASVDYLSSNYMSDPENGISYSTTDAHKKAVAGLLEDTDNGYSLEMAREYFRLAIKELEAEGVYTPGTKENPTVIELEIAWMYPQHETNYHNEIAKYFTDAFNDESVTGGKYRLDVKFWVGAEWSDVYYKKLMVGQYDLGFGSISGNALNPLDFMSVLSSDQKISGDFTLNWGTDTNDADADILVYNGVRWSFDALWSAAMVGAPVKDGELIGILSDAETTDVKANADSYEVTIKVKFNSGEGYSAEVSNFMLFGCNDTAKYSDYEEYSVMEKAVRGTDVDGYQVWTVTLTKEEYEKFAAMALNGIDVYYTQTVAGGTASDLVTVDLVLE